MRRAKNGIASFKREARHLFKRQYPTSSGEWSTLYYGIFKDWKRVLRKFPLGSDLKTAKDQLHVLEADNVKKKDFDLEKIEQAKAKTQGMTLEVWCPRYLELVKAKKSLERDKQHFNHLTRLLGLLPLSQINRPRIMEYKNQRLGEPIMRYGKPAKKGAVKVKISTINREISCLRRALNLAVDEGLIENVPRIRLDSEMHLQRDRVLDGNEYHDLLGASPRWLQRVFIGANDACLSRSDLLKLTWDSVGEIIKVRGGRSKTGVKQRVGISQALHEVFDELKVEQKRVPNTEHCVFTKDGRPITIDSLRTAFEKVTCDAGVKDFVFHDFRHCAKTRWAAAGLPGDISDVVSGHAIPGMRGRYTNLTDQNIRDAFEKMFTTCSHGIGGRVEGGAK